MWFEIALIIWLLNLIFFTIFWIVAEGARWQKHRTLGPFARFIQANPARTFFVFMSLTILMVVFTMMLPLGYWIDVFPNIPNSTAPVVNGLVLSLLLLSVGISVTWGKYRSWRQAVRSAAEMRVKTTR
ncbi:MAG: hypothetical protein QXS20_05480 [Candidatus Thorarchaeota archaeon]